MANKITKKHAPIQSITIEDSEVVISNLSLMDIAQIVGSTPYYVYDRQAIITRAETLKQLFPNEILLRYAIKSNPFPPLVSLMQSITDGLDVASLKELHLALSTGCKPEHITFSGPGKSDKELISALRAGIIINIESENELDRVIEFASNYEITPQLSLRINPSFTLKKSGMVMGGGPLQFGIDEENMSNIIKKVKQSQCTLDSLHIFPGTQNLSASSICEFQTSSIELFSRLVTENEVEPKGFVLGAGFGIPYFPGDEHLELDPIAANMAHLKNKLQDVAPDSTLTLELGRYLVGEAGCYVSKVIDTKYSRDKKFIVTDGGMNHNLAASGNLGQILRKNYPVCIANGRQPKPDQENVTVVGPLCTPLDLMAENIELPTINVGDLIAVMLSGAYGPSASPAGFLSHNDVAEILL